MVSHGLSFTRRSHLLPHVAVLVLLARAARARVVAADAVGGIADGLGLFRGLGRIRGYAIRTFSRSAETLGRGLICKAHNGLELFLFLHAEDRVGDFVVHAIPHLVARFHSFTL